MNRRSALILAGLGGASLATGLSLGPVMERGVAGAGELVFPTLATLLAQATRIELTGAGKTTTLLRTGPIGDDGWGVAERELYPVQRPKLRELLAGLAELRRTAPRTADPEAYARLGVEDPGRGGTAIGLKILNEQGRVLAQLITGHRRIRTQGDVPEQIYIRTPGDPQSWLADGRLPADADPQAWMVRELLDIPRSKITSVTLTREGETLVFGLANGGFQLLSPPDQKTEDYRIEAVAGALEALTLSDVKKAPLPGQGLGAARFALADKQEITITLARDGQKLYAAIDGATPALAGWAFELADWKEKIILPRLADLLTPAPK
jgi:hypothetical protein